MMYGYSIKFGANAKKRTKRKRGKWTKQGDDAKKTGAKSSRSSSKHHYGLPSRWRRNRRKKKEKSALRQFTSRMFFLPKKTAPFLFPVHFCTADVDDEDEGETTASKAFDVEESASEHKRNSSIVVDKTDTMLLFSNNYRSSESTDEMLRSNASAGLAEATSSPSETTASSDPRRKCYVSDSGTLCVSDEMYPIFVEWYNFLKQNKSVLKHNFQFFGKMKPVPDDDTESQEVSSTTTYETSTAFENEISAHAVDTQRYPSFVSYDLKSSNSQRVSERRSSSNETKKSDPKRTSTALGLTGPKVEKREGYKKLVINFGKKPSIFKDAEIETSNVRLKNDSDKKPKTADQSTGTDNKKSWESKVKTRSRSSEEKQRDVPKLKVYYESSKSSDRSKELIRPTLSSGSYLMRTTLSCKSTSENIESLKTDEATLSPRRPRSSIYSSKSTTASKSDSSKHQEITPKNLRSSKSYIDRFRQAETFKQRQEEEKRSKKASYEKRRSSTAIYSKNPSDTKDHENEKTKKQADKKRRSYHEVRKATSGALPENYERKAKTAKERGENPKREENDQRHEREKTKILDKTKSGDRFKAQVFSVWDLKKISEEPTNPRRDKEKYNKQSYSKQQKQMGIKQEKEIDYKQEKEKSGRGKKEKTGKEDKRKGGKQQKEKGGKQKNGSKEEKSSKEEKINDHKRRKEENESGKNENDGKQGDEKANKQKNINARKYDETKLTKQEKTNFSKQEKIKLRQEKIKLSKQNKENLVKQEKEKTSKQEKEKAAKQEKEKSIKQQKEKPAKQEKEKTAKQVKESAIKQEKEKAAKQHKEKASKQEKEKAIQQDIERAIKQEIEKSNKQEKEKVINQEKEKAIKEQIEKAIKQEIQKANEEEKAINQEIEKAIKEEIEKAINRKIEENNKQEKEKAINQEKGNATKQEAEKANEEGNENSTKQEKEKATEQEKETDTLEERENDINEEKEKSNKQEKEEGTKLEKEKGVKLENRNGGSVKEKVGRKSKKNEGVNQVKEHKRKKAIDAELKKETVEKPSKISTELPLGAREKKAPRRNFNLFRKSDTTNNADVLQASQIKESKKSKKKEDEVQKVDGKGRDKKKKRDKEKAVIKKVEPLLVMNLQEISKAAPSGGKTEPTSATASGNYSEVCGETSSQASQEVAKLVSLITKVSNVDTITSDYIFQQIEKDWNYWERLLLLDKLTKRISKEEMKLQNEMSKYQSNSPEVGVVPIFYNTNMENVTDSEQNMSDTVRPPKRRSDFLLSTASTSSQTDEEKGNVMKEVKTSDRVTDPEESDQDDTKQNSSVYSYIRKFLMRIKATPTETKPEVPKRTSSPSSNLTVSNFSSAPDRSSTSTTSVEAAAKTSSEETGSLTAEKTEKKVKLVHAFKDVKSKLGLISRMFKDAFGTKKAKKNLLPVKTKLNRESKWSLTEMIEIFSRSKTEFDVVPEGPYLNYVPFETSVQVYAAIYDSTDRTGVIDPKQMYPNTHIYADRLFLAYKRHMALRGGLRKVEPGENITPLIPMLDWNRRLRPPGVPILLTNVGVRVRQDSSVLRMYLPDFETCMNELGWMNDDAVEELHIDPPKLEKILQCLAYRKYEVGVTPEELRMMRLMTEETYVEPQEEESQEEDELMRMSMGSSRSMLGPAKKKKKKKKKPQSEESSVMIPSALDDTYIPPVPDSDSSESEEEEEKDEGEPKKKRKEKPPPQELEPPPDWKSTPSLIIVAGDDDIDVIPPKSAISDLEYVEDEHPAPKLTQKASILKKHPEPEQHPVESQEVVMVDLEEAEEVDCECGDFRVTLKAADKKDDSKQFKISYRKNRLELTAPSALRKALKSLSKGSKSTQTGCKCNKKCRKWEQRNRSALEESLNKKSSYESNDDLKPSRDILSEILRSLPEESPSSTPQPPSDTPTPPEKIVSPSPKSKRHRKKKKEAAVDPYECCLKSLIKSLTAEERAKSKGKKKAEKDRRKAERTKKKEHKRRGKKMSPRMISTGTTTPDCDPDACEAMRKKKREKRMKEENEQRRCKEEEKGEEKRSQRKEGKKSTLFSGTKWKQEKKRSKTEEAATKKKKKSKRVSPKSTKSKIQACRRRSKKLDDNCFEKLQKTLDEEYHGNYCHKICELEEKIAELTPTVEIVGVSSESRFFRGKKKIPYRSSSSSTPTTFTTSTTSQEREDRNRRFAQFYEQYYQVRILHNQQKYYRKLRGSLPSLRVTRRRQANTSTEDRMRPSSKSSAKKGGVIKTEIEAQEEMAENQLKLPIQNLEEHEMSCVQIPRDLSEHDLAVDIAKDILLTIVEDVTLTVDQKEETQQVSDDSITISISSAEMLSLQDATNETVVYQRNAEIETYAITSVDKACSTLIEKIDIETMCPSSSTSEEPYVSTSNKLLCIKGFLEEQIKESSITVDSFQSCTPPAVVELITASSEVLKITNYEEPISPNQPDSQDTTKDVGRDIIPIDETPKPKKIGAPNPQKPIKKVPSKINDLNIVDSLELLEKSNYFAKKPLAKKMGEPRPKKQPATYFEIHKETRRKKATDLKQELVLIEDSNKQVKTDGVDAVAPKASAEFLELIYKHKLLVKVLEDLRLNENNQEVKSARDEETKQEKEDEEEESSTESTEIDEEILDNTTSKSTSSSKSGEDRLKKKAPYGNVHQVNVLTTSYMEYGKAHQVLTKARCSSETLRSSSRSSADSKHDMLQLPGGLRYYFVEPEDLYKDTTVQVNESDSSTLRIDDADINWDVYKEDVFDNSVFEKGSAHSKFEQSCGVQISPKKKGEKKQESDKKKITAEAVRAQRRKLERKLLKSKPNLSPEKQQKRLRKIRQLLRRLPKPDEDLERYKSIDEEERSVEKSRGRKKKVAKTTKTFTQELLQEKLQEICDQPSKSKKRTKREKSKKPPVEEISAKHKPKKKRSADGETKKNVQPSVIPVRKPRPKNEYIVNYVTPRSTQRMMEAGPSGVDAKKFMKMMSRIDNVASSTSNFDALDLERVEVFCTGLKPNFLETNNRTYQPAKEKSAASHEDRPTSRSDSREIGEILKLFSKLLKLMSGNK